MKDFVQQYFTNLQRVMHRNFELKSNSIICLKNDEALIFYRCYLVYLLQSIVDNSTIYSAIPSAEELRKNLNVIFVSTMEINIDMKTFKILDLPDFFVKLQNLDNDLKMYRLPLIDNYFTIRNTIYFVYSILVASLLWKI
jgi:hypothetical protein